MAKCQVLHLGGNNSMQYCMLGNESGKLPGGKELGDVGQQQLSMSHQWAQVAKGANGILACIKNSMASRTREAFVPLYWALVRLGLKSCIQL